MEVLVGIFPEGDSPRGYTIEFKEDATDEEIKKRMKEIILSELNGRHGEADWAIWQNTRELAEYIKV